MSAVEFTQYALRNHVAPPSIGSTKARLRHAARRLNWLASRTRDHWYADDRIAVKADELRQIEELTGLRYGREEIRSIDELITQAETLMAGHEADFYGAFLTALRSVAGARNRTRAR